MLEEVHIDGSNVDFDSFNQMQVVLEGLFHLGALGDTMVVRFCLFANFNRRLLTHTF